MKQEVKTGFHQRSIIQAGSKLPLCGRVKFEEAETCLARVSRGTRSRHVERELNLHELRHSDDHAPQTRKKRCVWPTKGALFHMLARADTQEESDLQMEGFGYFF